MMNLSRVSDCHLAMIMFEDFNFNDDILKCSYCGKPCNIIPTHFEVGHDIELTLRRWKNGDCDIDGLFERLRTEYGRIAKQVIDPIKDKLQKGQPKFEYSPVTGAWSPTRHYRAKKVSNE